MWTKRELLPSGLFICMVATGMVGMAVFSILAAHLHVAHGPSGVVALLVNYLLARKIAASDRFRA